MIEMLDSCGDFVFVDFECVIVVFDVFVICIGMWFDVVCLNLYLFVVCFGNRDELVCIVSLDLVMLQMFVLIIVLSGLIVLVCDVFDQVCVMFVWLCEQENGYLLLVCIVCSVWWDMLYDVLLFDVVLYMCLMLLCVELCQ